jgi:mono/diheme cytochrome c family protein
MSGCVKRRVDLLLGCLTAAVVAAIVLAGSRSTVVYAGQGRSTSAGVYTAAQAASGETAYKEKCEHCHGEALQGLVGPPLTGPMFMGVWGGKALDELVDKIQNTMPADAPGTTTRPQALEFAAYMLQVGKFPAGQSALPADQAALKQITFPGTAAAVTPVASHGVPVQAIGNLAQVMRAIFFPSSNIIFTAQSQDPGKPKAAYKEGETGFSWADWGAGIYSGWEMVDYAAIALAEAAPLLTTPGRRCENGRPVPSDRADWIQYTQDLVEVGKKVYRLAQTRKQEAMDEASELITDACLACHEKYREKGFGPPGDPSNKRARCTPP